MKAFKKIFACFLIVMLSLSFMACYDEDPDYYSDYGDGSGLDYGDGSGEEYTSPALSIQTTSYLTRTKGGVQNASDEFYCGENVFLYVKLSAENRSELPQSASMTITFENARYLNVENESGGNVKPQIKESTDISGEEKIITVTGISFTVDPLDTRTREYVFLVRPTKACEGDIIVAYSGDVVSDESVAYQGYSFKNREHLDQIPTPVVTSREDGFVWTESPITNIGDKLYIVEIWDSNGVMRWNNSGSPYTKNYLTLADIASLELGVGRYKLNVKTMGDAVSTKDSETKENVFTIAETPEISLNESTISWDAVEGVSKYKISFGAYSDYVTENKFNMCDYSGLAGSVAVYIIPIFEDVNMIALPSNVKYITVVDAPVVTVSGAYASWSANGATLFDIYINGEYRETTGETKYRKQVGEGIVLTIIARTADGVISLPSQPVDISTD